jgi:hypothetical protein
MNNYNYKAFTDALKNDKAHKLSSSKKDKHIKYLKYLKFGLPVILLLFSIFLWFFISTNHNKSSSNNKGSVTISNQPNNIALIKESPQASILTPTPSKNSEKNLESPQIVITKKTTSIHAALPSPTLPSPTLPSPTPTNDTGVVSVFEHFNYEGWKSTFGVGKYTTADFIAHGGIDNNASSIKIPPGYRVMLFRNDNFSSLGLVLTSDTPSFSINFNDRLSSMIVERIGR